MSGLDTDTNHSLVDIGSLPLDTVLKLGDGKIARVLHRALADLGEPDSSVAAFNSSI